VDFFVDLCAPVEISEIILANAHAYDIPPSLAFALAWEESRFDPYALNTRNRDGSVDRGLFQLNSHSFPRLELQLFFNPHVNAQYAMGHLRYCLNTGGTEVAALAMYNAGTNRVNSAGTPKTTLDYASRILMNRWEIENLFREQETWLLDESDTAEIAEEKPERSRLMPLIPLAGK
jgi:soluble lytic murein transglycosylase-like protein